MDRIGVGIIGGGVRGWASISHVPALAALPGYELCAVSTSSKESAAQAMSAFGVPAAYDNHDDLVADPGVDLVVVSVKVPHHRKLVGAAIEAGKTVYCEWPLGTDLDDATHITAQADLAGVRTVIGVQARFSPVVRYVRDLVAQGYVGEVLGTTLVGSAGAWGPVATRANAYWFDQANGATTLSVVTMHSWEAVDAVLGDFAAVTADLVRRRDTVALQGEPGSVTVTAPDHVAVSGVLRSGAAASVYYRGGDSRGDNLRWEINGTRGDLVITSRNGNLQVTDLVLAGGRDRATAVAELAVPDEYYADVPRDLVGPAHNVAQLYAQLARDLAEGTSVVPGFAHALRRHRLVDAIEQAAATGVRRLVPGAGVSA